MIILIINIGLNQQTSLKLRNCLGERQKRTAKEMQNQQRPTGYNLAYLKVLSEIDYKENEQFQKIQEKKKKSEK